MGKQITKKEKEYIESELKKLKSRVNASAEELKRSENKSAFGCFSNEFGDLPDFESRDENIRLRNEINEWEKVLEKAEVSEVSNECIGLGTSFEATLNEPSGVVVTKKFTLFGGIIMAFDWHSDITLVSRMSPLGQAVFEKKENDEFSYVTPKNEVISGVINKILCEEKNEDKPKQLVKTQKNTEN